MRICCVPQCNNKYEKHCELRFHNFPKLKKYREVWLLRLRIAKKSDQATFAYVCSDHFSSEDYEISLNGDAVRLKVGSIPSKNLPRRPLDRIDENKVIKSQARYERICNKRLVIENSPEVTLNEMNNLDISYQGRGIILKAEASNCIAENKGTQTGLVEASVGSQTVIMGTHLSSYLYQTLSNSQIKYLTGFDLNRFNLLFTALKVDLVCNEFEMYLKLPDQLILCLIKLRHNLNYTLIGFMYKICRITVSKIFQHLIKTLCKYLKSIDFWGLKYANSTSYTAIIDCTEIRTERSQNPQVNQDLFSHYKNTFTLKYLVAIDEKGLVIFCSKVFGGSTSDRATVLESGFLDELKPEDVILADRGFDISDILETRKVVLNIPPFLRGKKQFSEDEVMETRVVANRRIHVERVIGLTKKFAILKGTFPAHLWNLADSIIYTVNMLCNFKNSVVA